MFWFFLLAIASVTQEPGVSPPEPAGVAAARQSYVLGPDDQIEVRAAETDFSERPIAVRIDLSGYVRLPMIGRIRASGLTVSQLESEISQRLKTYVREPDVSVSIVQFRSQPVSVIGAVKNPGVHQLEGRKTLIEMLALAGGLDTTVAGSRIKITRRAEWGPIPLKTASKDPTGQYSVAEVSVKSILDAKNPEDNLTICPFDVISVPRAELIYVTGQVQRSGGFVLNENETMTVLQAVTLAGGLDRAASPQNARILRRTSAASNRAEIAVDMAKIFQGKMADVPLQPDDILFVPASAPKRAALRAVEAAIQLGTGVVIWRR